MQAPQTQLGLSQTCDAEAKHLLLILLSQSCHADLGAARILFCGYSYLHDAAHHHGEQFERRLVFEDVCKQQLFFQIA